MKEIELKNKIFLINLMNSVWTYNIKYYLIIEKQLGVKYFIMDKDDESHWNNWDEDFASVVQLELNFICKMSADTKWNYLNFNFQCGWWDIKAIKKFREGRECVCKHPISTAVVISDQQMMLRLTWF